MNGRLVYEALRAIDLGFYHRNDTRPNECWAISTRPEFIPGTPAINDRLVYEALRAEVSGTHHRNDAKPSGL